MSTMYPWYDSDWLSMYRASVALLERECPRKVAGFEAALAPLRTRSDFDVVRLPNLLDEGQIEAARELIRSLPRDDQKSHEISSFGRMVVFDHPHLNRLQESLTDLVEDRVGEEVDVSYNFLSLYYDMGVCAVHMDSPNAKWTLDLCIDQSCPWPIFVGRTRDWAEGYRSADEDWDQAVRADPDNRFEPYSLEPGSAIIFSGSSSWHYRDPIPRGDGPNYCHLAFFHFVPRGMGELVDARNWPRILDLPELEPLIRGMLRLAALESSSVSSV